MSGPLLHLRVTYYLPSWQGGDRHMPICCKPRFGWCNVPFPAAYTDDREAVDCPTCLEVMAGRPNNAKAMQRAPTAAEHVSHVDAVLQATNGGMFPDLRSAA